MDKPVNVYSAYRQMLESQLSPKKETIDGTKWTKGRVGFGGPATDRYDEIDSSKHPNEQYKGEGATAFNIDGSGKTTAKGSVFSMEPNEVFAALENGASASRPVQSKLIPVGYESIGFNQSPSVDVGLVDALTWQCLMGNDINVKEILKRGYSVPRKYSGLSPITAAIQGKNIHVLKLVLGIPELRKYVNRKDGFGNRPLNVAAAIAGIDPYEFARELVKAGATDVDLTDGSYSAAMTCVLRNGAGAIWTPNIFSVILGVTNLGYTTSDGETVKSLAEKTGNKEALRMITNWEKFGAESQNNAVTDNGIAV